MADIQLKARSYKPGAVDVTLVDSTTATGYALLDGAHWGNAVWENFYSGQRGTQGARAAGGSPINRPVVLPIRITATSADQLLTRKAVLESLARDLRRFGGKITWRTQGGTYRQYFEVFAGSARVEAFGRPFSYGTRLDVVFESICAPYVLLDPMDVFDTFDSDSGEWVVDAGAGILAISGGQLVPSSTGNVRWRHTRYASGDCQATLKITTGSTVASYEADVCVNGDVAGADTNLCAQLFGGNLRIIQFIGGAQTVLGSTAYALSTTTTYWLRVRREGRTITAAVYKTEPSPLATPDATVTGSLSSFLNVGYGAGHAGFRLNVVATTERYDDFKVEPFTYGSNLLAPDERPMRPTVPGDAPPLADLVIAQSGGSAAPIFALAGWYERPSVWNYVWNGDFEDDVDGWSVAAVAGVTGAATSIARSTTAARNKYGLANAQIVCPATANTGTTFKINRRFYQGRDYIVLIWVSSAAGTTAARCRLGVSGDIASPSTLALSATSTLYATIWNPTADRDGAYAAFEITAATATTFNIDGVVVYEARSTTIKTQINPGDATGVVDAIPPDWPAVPFLALLNPESGTGQREIARVTAINSATNTLSLDRALEGTAAGTHAAANTISPLPEIRGHLEGKGAQPPVGVIEAESDDSGNRYTWTLNASVNARLGNQLYITGLSGTGYAAANYLIDPHLLVPDDYTQGEFAVEVWARINIHAGLDSPAARLEVAPETAVVASGIMTSAYGATRYAEEFGIPGRSLVKPSSGEVSRFVRLGTVRLPVDRKNPLRSRLHIYFTWGPGTASANIGCDYLVLVPANSRALSPSGRANDGNYPKFMASTAETQKTIRSDLSGLTAKPPQAPHPDHGLGGNLIELPPGNVDFLLKLSNLVPDDPTVDTTGEIAERPAGVAHLAVTPRVSLARGS